MFVVGLSRRIVVVMSGGLDSVCFAATLSRDSELYAITFKYGQRAHREAAVAKYFADLLRAREHKVVDIQFMKTLYGSSNALTDTRQNLTSSFNNRLVVPVRNAIFLTIASAWAFSIGASDVAYGAHTGDLEHYPDCRPEFATALASALNLGEFGEHTEEAKHSLVIHSPASLGIDKRSLAKSGYKILSDNIFKTWSCYSDGVKRGNAWLQCGICESCISRRRAFKIAEIEDNTKYASGGSKRHRG